MDGIVSGLAHQMIIFASMEQIYIYIIVAVVAAALAWLLTHLACASRSRVAAARGEAASAELRARAAATETSLADLRASSEKALQDAKESGDRALNNLRASSEKALQDQKESGEIAIRELKAANEKTLQDERESNLRAISELKEAHEKILREQKESSERALAAQKEAHERAFKEQKEAYEQSLDKQLKAVRAEMMARTEEILKAREAELSERAERTFKEISGDLGKDIQSMKEAFEAQKKSQTESTTSMRERFDHAVEALEKQTVSVGDKADRLAEALRGRKKMQGCWGETVLHNLLVNEGLVEGRDFEQESTLRDDLGFTILNEDSDRKMRPDFILHFPDGSDIIIDSKVSLSAFSDWMEAATEGQKMDAAQRVAAAVKEQAKGLARKDYSHYLRPGRRMLDFVIMFVPNYSAMQLALEGEPGIWREAYAQGVLITTSETLMPFLRMVAIAWTNVEQRHNQEQIIAAAQNMIDRVADFSRSHAEMGRKLEEAREYYDKCADKLKDSGRSIVQSARQVVKLGVPANPKKPLPETIQHPSELEES